VLTQFGLAETWHFFTRPERRLMVMLHMSFGILLGAAVLARVVWRLIPGHQVAPADSGLVQLAAKAVHYLLYVLIFAQFVIGFVLRWTGGEAMIFFGLRIAPLIGRVPRPEHRFIGELHNWVGWSIIALAAAHALAGLFHHFVVRDAVLARMIPALRARRAQTP